MAKYNPKKIEKKWQKRWYDSYIFKAKNFSKKSRQSRGSSIKSGKKFYLLDEFPYPSGDGLHVGHCRPYIALDIIARKRRMLGFNVLYPMGWDAFGLPTENYAIKKGVHPFVVTQKNTANFKRQMNSLGLSFDWSREINTTDPQYYRWTQWIFTKLFEKGLAYKDKMAVNWCPKDKIVLANEEVIGGKCERCGSAVEKREKEQWLIKITKYADRLIRDLDLVDYPDRVKVQQREWIGKSEGAVLNFQIINSRIKNYSVEVFTTRPDTLFGCTFLVLAPEHPLLENLKLQIENYKEANEYAKDAKNKSDLERSKEKTGIELKGIKAVNPANNEKIPVFIADYVMTGYGTGAIMAVPFHDQRDFEFAKKYNLPVKEVVVPNIIDKRNPPVKGKKFVERNNVHAIVKDLKTGKYLALKWKKFNWITFPMGGIEENEDAISAARREIKEETGFTNLELVKVLPSRTRAEYFAAHKDENRISYTTAVVFNLSGKEQVEISKKEKESHEVIWLTEDQLNYQVMTHAEVEHWSHHFKSEAFAYEGEGYLVDSGKFSGMDSKKAREEIVAFVGAKKTVQYKLRDWIFSRQHYWGEPIPMIFCNDCGWRPVPEKDLPVELPKVKKYQPTDTGESPLASIEKWVNIKCPNCGGSAKRETDTMPNWAGSNWYYLAYLTADRRGKTRFKIENSKLTEYWMPVDWYNGGMEHTTLHLLYSRFIYKFLWDIKAVPFKTGPEPYKKRTSHGVILGPGGIKMSKSRGNVINPDDVVSQYGADTLRVYEMFMGPFEQMIPWDQKGIIGPFRFLEKVYIMAYKKSSAVKIDENLNLALQKTIKKVSEDIELMKFNTAVSSLMEFANSWNVSSDGLDKKNLKSFLVILSPFAPHLSEELWNLCGFKGLCSLQKWPKHMEEIIGSQKITLIAQINGKVRDKIEIPAGLGQNDVQKIILQSEKIKKWVGGGEIKKIIFVADKLINIVL